MKKTQNQMNALQKSIYREFTDNCLKPKTLPSGAPEAKGKTVGLQKMDVEYRSSEYTKDPRYQELQKREEILLEKIETVKAIQLAQNHKAGFILGMQKSVNNTR
jgi:hypothetical protein